MNWTELKDFPILTENIFPAVAEGFDKNFYAAFLNPVTEKIDLYQYNIASNKWIIFLSSVSKGKAKSIQLVFSNGYGYLAYFDYAENQKVVVKTMSRAPLPGINKGTYHFIATDIISDGAADCVSLCLDNNGLPYVAFAESTATIDRRIRVKQLVKNGLKYNWQDVISEPGIYVSAGKASDVNIAVDKNNIPFIAFRDWTDIPRNKGRLIKLNNAHSGWDNLGFFSTGSNVGSISMAFNSENILYISYEDDSHNKFNSVTGEFTACGYNTTQFRRRNVSNDGWEDIDTFQFGNSPSIKIKKDDTLILSILDGGSFSMPLIYKYVAKSNISVEDMYHNKINLVRRGEYNGLKCLLRNHSNSENIVVCNFNFNIFESKRHLNVWELK